MSTSCWPKVVFSQNVLHFQLVVNSVDNGTLKRFPPFKNKPWFSTHHDLLHYLRGWLTKSRPTENVSSITDLLRKCVMCKILFEEDVLEFFNFEEKLPRSQRNENCFSEAWLISKSLGIMGDFSSKLRYVKIQTLWLRVWFIDEVAINDFKMDGQNRKPNLKLVNAIIK